MNTFWTKYLRPAVVLTLILTIVTGFLYPWGRHGAGATDL